MKSFAAIAFAALAAVATAQLSNIPSCALSCFLTPLSSDGCADLSDFACHCKKADSLFAAVTPCVEKACSAADKDTTIAAVESTCAAAGVPVQVPAASSAAPSTTAAPATSEAPSSTEAHSSTEVPATTAAPTSKASVPSSSAVISSVRTPSSNGTLPSSAAPTVTSFTGAAAQATQAAGILGAAALAFLAL